jgi:small subunit ribosomal protein S8e
MSRKITGGKYKKARKKKRYELPGKIRYVILGKEKRKKIRTRSGDFKTVLLSTDKANIIEKSGKAKSVKIKSILQVPSNRYLKGILFKGSIIETELGKARITNRPSQEGNVNAVLVD